MAVTKIRKFSSWTLLILAFISLVILALFYFGGRVAPENQLLQIMGKTEPTFTGLLLTWVYILLALVVAAWIIFSVVGFFSNLRHSPKRAINSLIALAVLAGLLVLTYFMGNGTPLDIVGYEGPDNVPKTLRMADMWLYSVYVLLGICILSMIFSPVIKMFRK